MLKKKKEENETIDHPNHYNKGKYEVIDVIEDWDLGFCLGNALKYIGRYKHKDKPLEDLKKAKWYLNRKIEQLKEDKIKNDLEDSYWDVIVQKEVSKRIEKVISYIGHVENNKSISINLKEIKQKLEEIKKEVKNK